MLSQRGLPFFSTSMETKVNGEEINNLQHLVDLVVAGTSEWVTFALSEDKARCDH